MKEIKIDLKYVSTFGVFICTLVGFYYTTNYRLESLEDKVKELESNNEAVIRLEERVKTIQAKTDEIYKHIIEYVSGD